MSIFHTSVAVICDQFTDKLDKLLASNELRAEKITARRDKNVEKAVDAIGKIERKIYLIEENAQVVVDDENIKIGVCNKNVKEAQVAIDNIKKMFGQ